jgi:hypothetical protein
MQQINVDICDSCKEQIDFILSHTDLNQDDLHILILIDPESEIPEGYLAYKLCEQCRKLFPSEEGLSGFFMHTKRIGDGT